MIAGMSTIIQLQMVILDQIDALTRLVNLRVGEPQPTWGDLEGKTWGELADRPWGRLS